MRPDHTSHSEVLGEYGRTLARLSVEVQLVPPHAVAAVGLRVDDLDRLVAALLEGRDDG